MLALIDANNFYCSCERAFDPELRGKPLVVLSNNDGCIISRSNEAKALGLKMAEPWHLAKDRVAGRGVEWRSSNYALYGDMSRPRLSGAVWIRSGRRALLHRSRCFLIFRACGPA